jgi:hypothetical protein
MIVRYRESVPRAAPDQRTEPLNPGAEYVVLEISTLSERPSYIRLEVVPGEPPALFDVRWFEVVSPRLPSNWEASLGDDGLLTLGPLLWRVSGFWEAFLDREQWATEVYDQERLKVLASSSYQL